jgi:hypothetical protein
MILKKIGIKENKINKALYLLANKYTFRQIETLIHIDRNTLSNCLTLNNKKQKISYDFADKVSKYVKKYKPNIEQIIKKYNKEALYALVKYRELSLRQEEIKLSQKIKKMREIDNYSFIKIGKYLNMDANSAHRLYNLSKNNNNKHSNIVFEKCKNRNKLIIKDYNNGMDKKELSQKYNLSIERICNILRNKFNIYYKRRSLTDADIKRIVQLRNEYKLTWTAISFIFNIPSASAQYYYKDYYFRGGKENEVNTTKS